MKQQSPSKTESEKAPKKPFFDTAQVFPKLTVNAPGDRYEEEADAMADQVMRMEEEEEGTISRAPLSGEIQRMCAECEEEAKRKPLQRKGEGGGIAAPLGLNEELQSSKGRGAPLPEATQQRMGQAFGNDFSGVRVHTGTQAEGMSQSIQAKAFTHGSDIYFNKGAYHPGSREGDHLIAHELTHVVQQGAGKQKPAPIQRSVLGGVLGAIGFGILGGGIGAAAGYGIGSLVGAPDIGAIIGGAIGLIGGAIGGAFLGDHLSSDKKGQKAKQATKSANLKSPRFAKNPILEQVYDGKLILKKGAKGKHISKLQLALQDAGFTMPKYGISGEFNDETQKAVEKFQKAYKITGDKAGEIGAATIKALDQKFPKTALPKNASGKFDLDCVIKILCAWNEPLIKDLKNAKVILVDKLYWEDEEYDGSSWKKKPFPGAGATRRSQNKIWVATNQSCQAAANTLYHEYQHWRRPTSSGGGWGNEEQRAYALETMWAIGRGTPTSPSMVETDPKTGEKNVKQSGVDKQVDQYPGVTTGSTEQVMEKVGANQVRVKDTSTGAISTRTAKAGDSVPGPQKGDNPRTVDKKKWKC